MEGTMSLQIANPTVVGKVERLAAETGLTKTTAVERAVDLMLTTTEPPRETSDRIAAILRQLDAIPDLPGTGDELEWDSDGLPA